MDFLFYKDILFEISKYLSLIDLRNLKLASPTLNIKDLFLQKRSKYPNISAGNNRCHDHSVNGLISKINDLNYQEFLFYDQKLDGDGGISFKIDYLEVDRLFNVDISYMYGYRRDGIDYYFSQRNDFRIKNWIDWRLFLLLKKFHRNQKLNDGLIRMLMMKNQLNSFIDQHLNLCCRLENFIQKEEDGKMILSEKKTLIIWKSLPIKQRIILNNQIKRFIGKGCLFKRISTDAQDLLKNWLK